MTHIDYTDSEHIWPGNDAAALLDGATASPRSAADAHQARQDDRLAALEGQLADALVIMAKLSTIASHSVADMLDVQRWRVHDMEPWRQKTYQRLARLEEAETHRRMNEAEP